MKIPRILKVQIVGYPQDKPKKTSILSYISFISGSLLAISEIMPFLDTRSNGILHAFSKIIQEFRSDIK